MAELQKVFVYVPTNVEDKFIETNFETTGAIKDSAKTTFANKIVFLEKTHRILVNGVFYGSDPAEMTAVNTAIEALEDLLGTDAEGVATDTGVNGATSIADAIKKIKDLLGYTKGDKVTESGEASTSLKDYVDKAKAAAEATAVAEAAKVEAKLPVVTSNTGSGISVSSTTDSAGKVTYTVTADQRIWEFMGTAEAASEAAVTDTLNGKYTAPDAQATLGRTTKEKGDVWSVTIDGKTTLRAWDGTNWVAIGSANGITEVNEAPVAGINLKNTAGAISVQVTPGEVKENNTAVVTGGLVYTAIENAKTYACTYAYNTANEAASTYAGKITVNGQTVDEEFKVTVYAGDIKIGGETADKDVTLAAAYAAIKGEIGTLKSNSTIINVDTTYMTVANEGATYTLGVKPDAFYAYVVSNMWETFVPQS